MTDRADLVGGGSPYVCRPKYDALALGSVLVRGLARSGLFFFLMRNAPYKRKVLHDQDSDPLVSLIKR